HAAMHIPHDGSYGLLIAVLGILTPAEAEAMVRIRQRAATGLAVVADAPSWALSKERTPELMAEQLAESVRMLRRGGWRVAVAKAGNPVSDVWTQLVIGDPGSDLSGQAAAGAASRAWFATDGVSTPPATETAAASAPAAPASTTPTPASSTPASSTPASSTPAPAGDIAGRPS
ncbi:MAG TPA: hypothetical protein VE287_09040, partial [Actinopolymorphaceae bacterium]|nr:hypothetical protein [Actinopolymorphaceae bacterium]